MLFSSRVRNQDGSALTIRIPRPKGDQEGSPPVGATTASPPPPLPRYAQLTTSRYAHMAPLPHHEHPASPPVPKSKSLSTSMDKLSHRDFQRSLSRGSTPSSGRSSVGAFSKTPTRRSPAASNKALEAVDGM